MKQDVLFSLVRTWKLNPKPQFRGFKCASCQRSLRSAWHHWLTSGGYKTPVHLCHNCEMRMRKGRLEVTSPRRAVLRSRFYTNLLPKVKTRLRRIVRSWRLPTRAIHKPFSCDRCKGPLQKAWHVWTHADYNLVETHLCKRCGHQLFSSGE